MLNLNVTGISETREAFEKLVPKLQNKALARLSTAIYDDAFRSIDQHTKTGALLQSLRQRRDADAFYVYNDTQRAKHALFVHWGSKAHVIRPNKKKALRWPKDGKFVFSRMVRHPGYKGDPWFVDAIDNAPAHFSRIITQLQEDI